MVDENSDVDDQDTQGEAAQPEVVVTEELASGESVDPGDASPEGLSDVDQPDVGDVAVEEQSAAEPEAAESDQAAAAEAEPDQELEATADEEAEPAAKPRKVKKPEVEEDDVVLDPDEAPKDWYILKVAFNREEGVRDALLKQIKISGLEGYFGEVLVPTEDIVEFTRSGKRKIVKRKLYPGYLMVYMHVNDDTWFLVRETNGVSDFTGTAGKPAPMDPAEVERVVKVESDDEDEKPMKTSIPFKVGERVRVKEGNFQNQEGEVEKLDEANGRISVNINIFGRTVPVELDHWQVEPL